MEVSIESQQRGLRHKDNLWSVIHHLSMKNWQVPRESVCCVKQRQTEATFQPSAVYLKPSEFCDLISRRATM